MMAIIEVAQPSVANPEAVINAAVAANAAAAAAAQAYFMSVLTLGALAILGAASIIIAYNFRQLERNTNSMKDQLVDATRKLALIEGNIIGRAEQTQETTSKEES